MANSVKQRWLRSRSQAVAEQRLRRERLGTTNDLGIGLLSFGGGSSRSCQWIEGEPRADAPRCGRRIQAGSSYCPEHHARCYVTKPQRDRNANQYRPRSAP